MKIDETALYDFLKENRENATKKSFYMILDNTNSIQLNFLGKNKKSIQIIMEDSDINKKQFLETFDKFVINHS